MHVRVLFERLRTADLKLTKHKCSFLKAHVQYLGHYISGQGLEPVPEKLEALVKMPPPEDVIGVRKFLGLWATTASLSQDTWMWLDHLQT